MSGPIGIVSVENPASLPALPSARLGGGSGFAAALDAASAAAGDGEERTLPPSVTAYNSLNLLNGRFPPPDSGAGFIFTVVAIMNEEAA